MESTTASGAAIVTHAAGAYGGAEITGTFDGDPGTYVCTSVTDNG